MATPSQQQARSHHARQAAISAAAVAAVRKLFERRAGWGEILPTVASYQLASAQASASTVADMAGDAAPLTNPAAFAGVSSRGFPIVEPIVAAIDAVVPAPAVPLPDTWWTDAEAFMAQIEQLIESEVQDAGRTASQVEFVTRPDWQNYVRMLQPPSCARCAILAGRIYRDLHAFDRHPQCFPAGVVVSGPATLGATRRWYEGELVVLRTASGEELPATGNHPVLTDQGWVPANLLQVGDHVVRSTRPEGALPLVVPDEQQAPALIEDARRSDGMVPFGVVPTATKDFHGDGGHGEVDVVLADRLLWGRADSALAEFGHQEQLAGGVAESLGFAASGSRKQLLLGVSGPTHSFVGSSHLGGALLGGHATGAHLPGGGHVSQFDTLTDQPFPNGVTGHAVVDAERVFALAGAVRRGNIAGGELLDSPRWDAPPGSLSEQNRGAYASRGRDLGHRIAGQVELDRLVEVRRVGWSGHVYNLTSAEGWFSANGLIVSNCDCVMVPVQDWEAAHDAGLVSSPETAFEKGQIRGLSKADTQAIRDGADITEVVNAGQGISSVRGSTPSVTTELFGRRIKATTYGTTRRARWRKANPTRLVRLRPESIYDYAKDRDDAIRLLRLYGYIR